MEEKASTLLIEIVADTSKFKQSVDECIEKVKELIQLCEQTDKLFSGDIRNQLAEEGEENAEKDENSNSI